jgi:hypothetical protein
MNAIRIRKRIDSDTPHLPELRPLIGKTVEIIILDDTPATSGEVRETEVTFFGLAPPLPTAEEQTANLDKLREMARDDPRVADLLRAVEADAIDVQRVIQARGLQ